MSGSLCSSTEVWLPVKGYEGLYEVSSLGRVKSLPRNGTAPYPKIRKLKTDKDGYLQINLSRNNVVSEHRVHHLVAEAFIGPREKDLMRHLNGDPTDNRPENLAWGTHSENQQDSLRQGTHVEARKTHCPRGHDYSLRGNGKRYCKTCHAFQERQRRAKARSESK